MQLSFLTETPCSNTGLDSPPSPLVLVNTTIPFDCDTPVLGIDALTLLWYECEGFDILPFIRDLLDVQFDFTSSFPQKIGVLWDKCFRGSFGCKYMCRAVVDDSGHFARIRYRLTLSGQACSRVPLESLIRFMEVVFANNPKVECSRIDIRLDDYSKRLTFDNLCAALDSKNYSGFLHGTAIKNYDGSDGWTVNLGSRESDHFVRAYNKLAESKGRINAHRWESEFKNGKADYIFHQLASQKDIVSATACLELYIFGNFDFIYKDDKNLERCDRLGWWEDFLTWLGFGRGKIIVEKVKSTIESRIVWIKKQVEKSLALLSRAFGLDDFETFIGDCVASGSRRLRKFDDILLLEYLDALIVR